MSIERTQFAAYFTARRDVVRRTAYLLCGDWHFADDLTQITFVKLAGSWRRVRDREALDAYVHTILIRSYLSETRRWFRRRERSTAEFAETAAGPDAATESVGRRLAVAAALAKLPAGQRAVIVARYYVDLDVAAAAEALGCSPGTVKSQTARAMDALRRHLAGLSLSGVDLEVSDATT